MTRKRLLQQVFGLTLIAFLLTGCSGALAEQTATPAGRTVALVRA